MALPVGIVVFSPGLEIRGLLFGVAAGVFLHVAVDLLPECTTGSETCPVDAADHDGDLHQFQDRLAALSSVFGGSAVVVA